jgi:hypothetical protein
MGASDLLFRIAPELDIESRKRLGALLYLASAELAKFESQSICPRIKILFKSGQDRLTLTTRHFYYRSVAAGCCKAVAYSSKVFVPSFCKSSYDLFRGLACDLYP